MLPAQLAKFMIALALAALPLPAQAQSSGAEPLRVTSITPSGANVPPGRQIVIQFNRPVVAIGRMARQSDELPISIAPALACDWRWLDTSALACQLGDGNGLLPATEYEIVIAAAFAAEDGAMLGTEIVQRFETERPRVSFASFSSWLGPGTPVIRIVFNQPVSLDSAAAHLYLQTAERERAAVVIAPDDDDRMLPRFMPLPGELAVADFGRPQAETSEDAAAGRVEARRVWLVRPVDELPGDLRVRLMVESGLESADGPLAGDEDRVVVEFDTFPDYAFIGVVCRQDTRGQNIVIDGSDATAACNPMQRIGLAFTTPTIPAEIRDRVALVPDLAGGRTDYDPWANAGNFSLLRGPHQRGRQYVVWLPERLRADQPYELVIPAGSAGPRDEFGRALAVATELEFRTGHRPPALAITHPLAIVEAEADSAVPFYVTNIEDATLRYRRLTPAGADRSAVRAFDLAEVDDVQYAVPLGLRDLLDGGSGAVYGTLETVPPVALGRAARNLFAEVTPFQVHAKLGHFNTSVWVTELATGEPVTGARVSIYVDRLANLTADFAALAEGRTDRDGLALLAGSETLDPDLALTSYSCGANDRDLCPRLFVRVDHAGEIALLPLDYRFEVNPYRVSSYSVYRSSRPQYGHLQAWGMTAQGVYRAGDTIDYKLWVRNQSNETQVPAPPGSYRLEIVDPTGQVAVTVDGIELSAFGAYDGRFELPATAPIGWYQFRLRTSFDDSVHLPLRVLVTDFTPSSFRVSAALDGDRYLAGDEVTVEAGAALFSGGPYRDAEARISASVTALGFRSTDPLAAGFRFGGETRITSLQVAQSTGPVDDDGRVVRTFALPADLGRSMTFARLSVEAAVRDDRGRYVAASASARVLTVDRIVGLRMNQWLFSEDQPAEVETIVVDPAGTPVAGTAVAVVVERLETMATRVRGAGNAFLTEYIDEWVAVADCAAVSTAGPEPCGFVPEQPGRYRITASIEDTAGRAHVTTLTAWVQGKGRVVWNAGNDDALEVVPEGTELEVGDTARYLVQNPYPGAKALITIERYGVIDQWVETFASSTPVVEFEIGPDYLPGFFLSILVMSPRVAAPLPEPGELDLGKPAFKMAYLGVPVRDAYKTLEIEVETDRASYKPRDTVSVEIRARPKNRELAEPIEVAVVVLDEAVLDLIQGGTGYFDPYTGFNRLDGLDMQNYGLLTRLVGRQRIELKGANPGGDGGAALSMRSIFRFVAHFEPALTLDRRGRGELSFELPDNLTGWRVLVLGATPTDRFGLGETAFTATLPTEIRPLLPNQVTEGDLFSAGASVMNRTDEHRRVDVQIVASGDLLTPVVHQETLALAPFERGQVHVPVATARLPIERDRDSGLVRFEISARDAVDGDALVHELPVLKHRVLQTAASFGTLTDEAATATLAFPDAILTDVGEVGVELYASVIGNVDGALRAAKNSVYLFWELMLSKALMASSYERLGAYAAPDLEWPGSATLPAATLQRAAAYQAPNGGMAYLVPRDEYVSPYLSAYTALAFVWLRRDGHAIPDRVEQRLLAYLDALIRRDVVPDFYDRGMTSTVRAVALAALAAGGRLTPADLARYREHVDYMSLFGKAHYLMAAAAVPGSAGIAAEVAEIIMRTSTRSAGKLQFNERLDDGYRRLLSTPMRAQCAILSALTRVPDGIDGASAFALVRAITQGRGNRAHWENLQENVFCMNALIDYAARFETETPAIEVTAAIDGAPLGRASFGSVRDPATSLLRPIGAPDQGARRELTIAAEGPGRLYYAARMSYAESADATSPINAGIDVRREQSVERDGEWVLLDDRAEIGQGELVRIDLYLSLPAARHFVVVDDPIPGGLEPINRDLANASIVDADAGEFVAAGGSWWFQFSDWQHYAVSRWSFHHRELAHDAARFYADYLPPGNYHLSYTAQAIAPGTFSRVPVTAREAYDPDVYGQGRAGTLTVSEP